MNEQPNHRQLADLARVLIDIPVGFCIFDLDFRFTFVNEYLAVLNGASVEQHIGRTIFQAVPDVAAGVEAQLRQVVETGEAIIGGEVEAETPAFPGEKRFFQHTYTAIKDDFGTVIGVSCLVQDITEEKSAEDGLRRTRKQLRNHTRKYTEQMRESERQIRMITDALPVLITYMGKDRRFQYANKTAATWYGRPINDVVGKTVPELLGQETNEKFEPFINKAIAGKHVTFETTVTYPDRQTRNVHVTYVPDIAAVDGEVQGYFGLVVDLTAYKQVEAARAAAEMYLSSAIESISEGFILYDQDDTFVMCNDRFKDFYPRMRDVLVPGTKLEDLARLAFERGVDTDSTEDGAQWVSLEHAQRQRGRSLHEQQLRDGRWLLCSMRRTAGGYTVGIRTDITEIKQTADDLRHAQKMEAIGQLTGGVAHDFKNLLAVVMGNLELLYAHTESDETLGKFVERAIAASKRGADLTDRLLAFSRKQPLRPVPIIIDQLVHDMQELLERTLGREIEIEFTVSTGLWPCEVDPGQLENTILNLSLNARDAMPHGGKLSIAISNANLECTEAAGLESLTPGRYVLLAISDSGTGMAAEVMEQAFDPFFTTKEVGKGSGLGLSMIYGFVKQSGGQVRILSKIGEGTTVKIYLPRSSTDAVAIPNAEVRAIIDTTAQGETVLVLEDDADVRAVTVGFLDQLGYQVLEAGCAETALEQIEQDQKIDMLVADIILPGDKDGRDLADKARGLLPSLKVLYISGFTKDAMVHHGRLEGHEHLLAKPFSHEEFGVKIRQILDGVQ